MAETERSAARWPVRHGDAVICVDGAPVGTVVAFHPDRLETTHIVVEREGFCAPDYYVPLGALARREAGRVHLWVTRDEARRQGWAIPPDAAQGAPGEAGLRD